MNSLNGGSPIFAKYSSNFHSQLLNGTISPSDLSSFFSEITDADLTVIPPDKPHHNEIFIYKSPKNNLQSFETWKKDGYYIWNKTFHTKLYCSKTNRTFTCLESQFEDKGSILKRIAYLGYGFIVVAYSVKKSAILRVDPLNTKPPAQESYNAGPTGTIPKSTASRHFPSIIPSKRQFVAGSSVDNQSPCSSKMKPKITVVSGGQPAQIKLVSNSSYLSLSSGSSIPTITISNKKSPIIITPITPKRHEEIITSTPATSKVQPQIESKNSNCKILLKQLNELNQSQDESVSNPDIDVIRSESKNSNCKILLKQLNESSQSQDESVSNPDMDVIRSESKNSNCKILLKKLNELSQSQNESLSNPDMDVIRSATNSELEEAIRRMLENDRMKNGGVLASEELFSRAQRGNYRRTTDIRLLQLVHVRRVGNGSEGPGPTERKFITEDDDSTQEHETMNAKHKLTVSSMDELLESINPDMISDCVPFRPKGNTLYIYNRSIENWQYDGYYFVGDGTRIMQSRAFQCCILQHKYAVVDNQKKLNRRFLRISFHYGDYIIVLYKGDESVACDRARERKFYTLPKKTSSMVTPKVTSIDISNFLTNLTDDSICEEVPYRPPGDSVFVYKPDIDPKSWNDWSNDGYPWKNDGHRTLRSKTQNLKYPGVIYASIDNKGRLNRNFTRCVYYTDTYVIVVYRGNSELAGTFSHKKDYLANRSESEKNQISILTIYSMVIYFEKFDSNNISTKLPYLPQGGDAYIFRQEYKGKLRDWLQDGYEWSVSTKKRLSSPRYPRISIDYMEYKSININGEEDAKFRRLVYFYEKFLVVVYQGCHNLARIIADTKPSQTGQCINVGLHSFKLRKTRGPQAKKRRGHYFSLEKGLSRVQGNVNHSMVDNTPPDEYPGFNFTESPPAKRLKISESPQKSRADKSALSEPPDPVDSTAAILQKLDQVLQRQADFNNRLQRLSNMVTRLDKQMNSNNVQSSSSTPHVDLPVTLPIDNVEDLDTFNQWLSNKENLQFVLRYYNYLTDEEYVLHVTMCTFFHDNFIPLLDWSKVYRKIDLSQRRHIVKLIIAIMKSSDNTLKDNVIRKGINDWLKFSHVN